MSLSSTVQASQSFVPQTYSGNGERPVAEQVEQVVAYLETIFLSDVAQSQSIPDKKIFEEAFRIWNSLNIQPETLASFMEIMDQSSGNLGDRFIQATLSLSDMAYTTGKYDQAVEILKRIVYEKNGESWYKLNTSVSLHRNGWPYCNLSEDTFSRARFFQDIHEFLAADVSVFTQKNPKKKKAALAVLESTCYASKSKPIMEVEIPETVTILEGTEAHIPIRINSNIALGDLYANWYSLHQSTGYLPYMFTPYFQTPEENLQGNLIPRPNPTPSAIFRLERYYLDGYNFGYFGLDKNKRTELWRYIGDHRRDYPFETIVPADIREFNLVIPIARITRNHEQPEFLFVLDFFSLTVPSLKVQKTVRIKIENRNEPPTVFIKAPKHVAEGNTVCFGAEIGDPEGDPVNHNWQLKKGNGTPYKNDSGDFCVKTPVTGRFEYPLDVRLTAEDKPDLQKYPGLQSGRAKASARVFIDPTLALTTEKTVKPSKEVVEIMSNPDITRLDSAAMATNSNFYVFLRLPESFENFNVSVDSDIATRLLVDGNGVSGFSERKWSPFEELPAATHVALSHSPIRKWTPGGHYSFPGFVRAKEKSDHFSLRVTVDGEANIDPPESRMGIHVDKEVFEKTRFQYRFHLDNILDEDGKPFLQSLETLPVSITITQSSPLGEVTIQRSVEAKRIQNTDNQWTYEISFLMPEEYASNAYVAIDATITNRYNETGHIRLADTIPSHNTPTFFENLTLQPDTNTIPVPWYLLHLQSNPQTVAIGTQTYLENLKANLHICPPEVAQKFIQNCSSLSYQPDWGTVENPQSLLIPLRLKNGLHHKLALVYRATGGSIGGDLTFKVPILSTQWDAKIELRGTNLKVSEDPTLPIDWTDFLDMPKEVLEYLLKMMQASLKRFQGHAKFSTLNETIKPRQTFFVDMTLTTEEEGGKIKSTGLTEDINEYRPWIKVSLKPKNASRTDTYYLNPTAVKQLENGKYRFEFQTPASLPRGEYEGYFTTETNFYANYDFTYTTAKNIGEWHKIFPIIVWNTDNPVELQELQFVGNPAVEPPTARGFRKK